MNITHFVHYSGPCTPIPLLKPIQYSPPTQVSNNSHPYIILYKSNTNTRLYSQYIPTKEVAGTHEQKPMQRRVPGTGVIYIYLSIDVHHSPQVFVVVGPLKHINRSSRARHKNHNVVDYRISREGVGTLTCLIEGVPREGCKTATRQHHQLAQIGHV